MTSLVRQQMGGTEVYAKNLVRQLALKNDERFRFIVVYSKDGLAGRRGTEKNSPSSNTTEVVLPYLTSGMSQFRKIVFWFSLSLRRRGMWKEIERSSQGAVDIALYPFSAVIPKPLSTTKTVTIIHDLQHREIPKSFTWGQRFFRRHTYELPARKADAILTVSEFTKQTIIKFLTVDPQKIHRIYPGLSSRFLSVGEQGSPRNFEKKQFLYYPARGLPHKNHQRLFEAFALVRQVHPELTLTLSGSDADYLGKLPENVKHLGNLTAEEIAVLYQSCRAVVFPTLYEGFGFPAIEALGMRAPLVVSNAGSLPEVVAGFAIIVNPLDVESISEGILRALELRREPAGSREWVEKFTWEQAASEVLEVLAAVHASPR